MYTRNSAFQPKKLCNKYWGGKEEWWSVTIFLSVLHFKPASLPLRIRFLALLCSQISTLPSAFTNIWKLVGWHFFSREPCSPARESVPAFSISAHWRTMSVPLKLHSQCKYILLIEQGRNVSQSFEICECLFCFSVVCFWLQQWDLTIPDQESNTTFPTRWWTISPPNLKRTMCIGIL